MSEHVTAAERAARRSAPLRGLADASRVGVQTEGGSDAREVEAMPTRKRRGERMVNDFDIPAHRKKPGWDYQWWTVSVLNEGAAKDTTPMNLTAAFEGGWRPVPPGDMPELSLPGYAGSTIDRYGQRLFMRPMSLTLEARKEDWEAAEQQRIDRIQGAAHGRVKGHEALSNIRGIVPRTELSIEGEMGAYDRSPLGEK